MKDRVREAIYRTLYEKPYKFATTKATAPGSMGAGGGGISGPGPMDEPEDFGPTMETKPYIPPTDPEDLMKVLDAPLS